MTQSIIDVFAQLRYALLIANPNPVIHDERVRQNLDNATIQDKRLALDALDIRITASIQAIDIKGIIPVEIATMAIISRCYYHCTNMGMFVHSCV